MKLGNNLGEQIGALFILTSWVFGIIMTLVVGKEEK